MLQEIFVTTLTKLQFTHVAAALCKHDIFLGVTSRSLLRFIETGKQFATVLDLTVGCSLKLGGHAADTESFLSRNQDIIFGSGDLYPVSFNWTPARLTRRLSSMLKSVSIAGHRIPIRVRDLDDCYGQYLPDAKVIELDRKTVKDAKLLRETLRHEMVEAALFLSGVSYSDVYTQEPIVRALDELFWPAWEKVNRKI